MNQIALSRDDASWAVLIAVVLALIVGAAGWA